MASTRYTVVSALITCCGATVVALSHCMNGITFWVIPIASAFTCIMFHALNGDRNWATISGCTRKRGDINARGIDTLSVLGVFVGNLGVPDGRRTSAASVLSSCVTSTFLRVSHTGINTTVAGSWPSQMFLAKSSTFLSSYVCLAKGGVKNWVPHSTML